MTFTLSSDAVNSYGFILKTAGINLSLFEKNPVMLFGHNSNLVIGKWANIRKENGQLLAEPVFDENDPFALQVKSKVEQGFLKACSIGFNTNWEKLTEQEGVPVVEKSTLLEASIVAIPANSEAQIHLCHDYNLHKILAQLPAQAKHSHLEAEIEKLQKTVQNLEKQAELRLQQDKQQMLHKAIEDRKITKREADILASLPISELRTIIKERKAQPTILEQIKLDSEEQLSFDYLSKHNPERLAEIRKNDPELYKNLYYKEFGKGLSDK